MFFCESRSDGNDWCDQGNQEHDQDNALPEERQKNGKNTNANSCYKVGRNPLATAGQRQCRQLTDGQ